jgi:hypothetical protein
MIGVICDNKQRPFVAEFFELFKVPWEYCIGGKQYDVVLVGGNAEIFPQANLVIVFGSKKKPWDIAKVTQQIPSASPTMLEHEGYRVPVYGRLAKFESSSEPILKLLETEESVGVKCIIRGQNTIRVGYDLFDEVQYLLSNGQPVNQAPIPTIDAHIGMIRKWIIEAELYLVEIPPIPSGHNFIVCLTHDVDFVNMCDHGILDRSVLGFIVRSLFPRNWRDAHSKIAWSRIRKNWSALLSLPAMYLGLRRDIWFDIDKYMELEHGLGSTFYFIPLKGHPGVSGNQSEPHWRAARYDVKDYQYVIDELKQQRSEIGVHGIDAWHDSKMGIREGEIVQSLSGKERVGIRMHWLYFSRESPKVLEEAGFDYDSTVGYNEANGFRCGTAQVFCLPGSRDLLELPLNIMDSALFYPSRMGLSEADAMKLCKTLVASMKSYGGVLTINWHTRSLSPERNWDAFYIELLDLLKGETVWFARAEEAVAWFRKRRQVAFEKVEITPSTVKIALRGLNTACAPGFRLRVHRPLGGGDGAEISSSRNSGWIDVPLTKDGDIEIPMSSLPDGTV